MTSADSGAPAVVAQGLRRTFAGGRGGEVVAVADLTLDVREGELFGLLGPSGCGKTTSLRLIAASSPPRQGRCTCGASWWRTRMPSSRRSAAPWAWCSRITRCSRT